MVGRTYLWHGRPVVVEVQWRTGLGSGDPIGPRNVAVRTEAGERVVVPVRALRRSARR